MTEKELKRLNRVELLELLLIQTRETERLRMMLETAQQKLENREIQIGKCGTLAEATLVVNGVLEAAQATADHYLENIARMERETREKCRKMLEEAEAEATRILTDAKAHRAEKEKLDALKTDQHKSLSELLNEARVLIGEEK